MTDTYLDICRDVASVTCKGCGAGALQLTRCVCDSCGRDRCGDCIDDCGHCEVCRNEMWGNEEDE